ncbi:MAG: sigma factor [Acidimicrobiales bacterium]
MGGSGEEEFERFFRGQARSLMRQAYLLTGDAGEAQDLVQETMIRAWREWPRLQGYDDPGAWARQVLHRLAIGRWRRLTVRPGLGSATPDDAIGIDHLEDFPGSVPNGWVPSWKLLGPLRPHLAWSALAAGSVGAFGLWQGRVVRLSFPGTSIYKSFTRPAGVGPFWPTGIAVAANGTIYLDQKGNGGVGPPAIISLSRTGHVGVLWVHSTAS